MAEETIAELIAKKRAAGYDAEFEARLARRWECPHCRHRCTILQVLIPVGGDGEMACPECKREGISIIKTDVPDLKSVVGGKV